MAARLPVKGNPFPMNSLVRFLTFSARYPTHVYETAAYMTARLLLGVLAFFASYVASPAHVAPFLLLSFAVSIGGASAAQTVRSGAARRQEKREREGTADVSLPCDADLRRAATLGSMLTSCAPMLALGQALASHAVGALRGWALAAALLSVAQSAFDVAWSLWLYPAWRRTYARQRDRLRSVAVTKQGVVYLFESTGASDVRDAFRRIGEAARLASDDEDAPTTVFTSLPPCKGGKNFDMIVTYNSGTSHAFDAKGEMFSYVRCDSLDDLLARTVEPAPVGTRLYTVENGPTVEYGGAVEGWFVEWSGGTINPVEVLRTAYGRRRFDAESNRNES